MESEKRGVVSGGSAGHEDDKEVNVTVGGRVDGFPTVSVPDMSCVRSVSVPCTWPSGFPLPHPVTVPVQNSVHANQCPWHFPCSLAPYMQKTAPQGATPRERQQPEPNSQPPPRRSNIKPPLSMPLTEDKEKSTPQGATAGEQPSETSHLPPRRSNIKPPSTISPTGDPPPEHRVTKRRVTITPPFTPVSTQQ